MTHPGDRPQENQQHFPVLEPYAPTPAQVPPQPQVAQPQAPQPTAAYQVFQPAVELPAGPEFHPVGPPPAESAPTVGAPRKKTGLVVTAVLAVLFFATAGVFGVLYSNQVGQNDRLSGQLAEKEKELDNSAKQLKDAQDETSKAKDAANVAESGRKRAEDQSAGMVKCRDAARVLREAIFAKDVPKADAAFLDVVANC